MSPATRYPRGAAAAWRRRGFINRLNLTTGLGLTVARLGAGQVRPGPEGLLLAEGYRPRFPRAGAFTIGNVVITAYDFDALERATPGVIRHESRHAWQYYRLGLAFLPCYVVAAGWSWLRFGDPAVGNPFERNAGLVTGGYVASPRSMPTPTPTSVRIAALTGRLRVRRGRYGSGAGRNAPPDGARADAADA